jgi:uncharacterized protein YjbI with pentapeptide repeats
MFFKRRKMKKLLLKLAFTTLLLSVAYSQCNESNWESYYPEMQGCDLSYANLSDANLMFTDLSGAYLYGAHLSGAYLGGACLEGAIQFTQTNYFGTPILEGCASGGGDCSFEDTDEDGYDDTSFAAGVASVDANNDGLVDAFPTLSIINGNATVLIQGILDEYTDSGASCSDQEDGNISQNVEVSGQVVNMNIPGTYTVSYDCSDSDGNAAQTKSRTVFVIGSLIADENGDGFDDDAFLAGAQSGDISGNGTLNITDIIMYIELIINAD